jgi:DNA-binding transcriptional regulator/RsmH inhibitor MraZ
VLIDGQPDACRPLHKSMVRVEVQQVAVATSCGNAQNVLERLLIAGASRQRLDLQRRVVLRSGPKISLDQL